MEAIVPVWACRAGMDSSKITAPDLSTSVSLENRHYKLGYQKLTLIENENELNGEKNQAKLKRLRFF